MSEEEQQPVREALTDVQIDMAKIMIDDYHAIDTTPYDVAFPWLCCWLRPFRECREENQAKKEARIQREGLKAQLLNKVGKDKDEKLLKHFNRAKQMRMKLIKKEEQHKGKDPYLNLGFGLQAYRGAYWRIIIAFIFMVVCVEPIRRIYSQGAGYDPDEIYKFENWSIANLGYSSVRCANIPFGLEKIVLQCPYGIITKLFEDDDNQLTSVGLNSGAAGNMFKDACMVSADNQNTECSAFIDQAKIRDIFETNCKGNTDCSFDLGIDLENGDFSNSFITKPTEGLEDCANKQSQLFVQYSCEQTEAQQYDKYNQIAFVTVCTLTVTFFFILYIQYMQQNGKLNVLRYDLRTVTASDFTVELDITQEDWELFQQQYEEEGKEQEDEIGQPMSPGLFFKNMIKDNVEMAIIETLSAKYEQMGITDEPNASIIDIQFAFNNYDLLSALKVRGTALTNLDFEKVKEQDKYISDMIKDGDNYEKLTRPVCAFVTFESDDAYNAALSFTKSFFGTKSEIEGCEEVKIFERTPYFTKAVEPTNIIWENRHIKGINFGLRILGASLISLFMLSVAFTAIFLFKKESIKLKQNQPDVNCDSFVSLYGESNLIKYASYEYFNTIDSLEKGGKAPPVGALQCFCQEEKKKFKKTDFNRYLNKHKYTVNNLDGEEIENSICYDYTTEVYKVKGSDQIIKFGIIFVNTFIRIVVIKIITAVGCSTESVQLRYITEAVFLCQFFNTAFLILLVDANLGGQTIFLAKIFNGHTTDFNADWFQSMGNTLIGSMKFNVWYPIANDCLWFGIRTLKRVIDKLRAPDGKQTNCITMQQYVNIYAGPNFFMHYKYSSMMNIIFITMMYGVGMPILFPIALATYCVVYCLEKYMMYYVYKSPPAYDEYLNEAFLGRLTIAPLFMLGFGYWMLTNKQMLSNDYLMPRQRMSDPFVAQHYWYEAFTPAGIFNSGPGGVLGLFFFLYFFWLVFRKTLGQQIRRFFGAVMIDDFEINEDLETYQCCLDKDDRTFTLYEEKLMRDYGIQTMPDIQRDTIRDNKLAGKHAHLQGIHSYDMLRNQSYIAQFQYISADTPDRADYIITEHNDLESEDLDTSQSDLVRIVLNLCYLTKEEVQALDFTREGLDALRAECEIDPADYEYQGEDE